MAELLYIFGTYANTSACRSRCRLITTQCCGNPGSIDFSPAAKQQTAVQVCLPPGDVFYLPWQPSENHHTATPHQRFVTGLALREFRTRISPIESFQILLLTALLCQICFDPKATAIPTWITEEQNISMRKKIYEAGSFFVLIYIQSRI